jgi:hypothetical protein
MANADTFYVQEPTHLPHYEIDCKDSKDNNITIKITKRLEYYLAVEKGNTSFTFLCISISYTKSIIRQANHRVSPPYHQPITA